MGATTNSIRSAAEQEGALIEAGDTLGHWLGEAARAAETFEARWTWTALKRVNPDLHEALFEQRSLFREMTLAGSLDDVAEHGAAMCRGYVAAVKALEDAEEPDDSYWVGLDSITGLKLAIGHQKAAAGRAREVHGDSVVWMTPDEVATILARMSVQDLIEIKRRYPGAEIVRYHAERERAAEDAA